MSTPQISTIVKPPIDVFDDYSAMTQKHEESVGSNYVFDRVDYPDEGGMLVYYYDHPFPAKGNPFPAAVDAIHVPKKLFKSIATFFYVHKFLAVLVLITPNFILKRFVNTFMKQSVGGFAYAVLAPYFLLPNRYCKMVREIRRAGFKVADSYEGDWKKYFTQITVILASVLEWDNAWRYRVQDILGDLNKEAFIKNPSKEIHRLLILEVQRERGWVENKGRFLAMGQALRMALIFKPIVKRVIVEFVKELNIDEVKLDEADDYYCFLRPDYDIHGWPFEQRQRKAITLITEYRKNNPERTSKTQTSNQQKVQVFDAMKTTVLQDKGFPLIMFYAVQDDKVREDGKMNIVVKKMETITLQQNPELKKVCTEVMNANV